jgi:hypothetical protein
MKVKLLNLFAFCDLDNIFVINIVYHLSERLQEDPPEISDKTVPQ